MHATAWPETIEVGPGDTGFVSIAITNTSAVIDAYRVQVFGLDPTWVDVQPAELSLFPGATENVSINLTLPTDYPASRRTLAVNVVSEDDPGNFSLTQIELAVAPQTATSVHLDPVMVSGGRRATFGLVVANVGNAAVAARPYAEDPEALSDFSFEPPDILVAPGREQVIRVDAQGGRSWFGQPRARIFTMGVDAEQRVETIGTFIQRPRIPRWLMSLLGLLTAAAVFAAVLANTFDKVVDDARLGTDLLDQALSSDDAGGAEVPTNPGGVDGTLVLSTTGQGLAGAQAELYVVDQYDEPHRVSATDSDGGFSFSTLGHGTYKLLLTGSGVNQLWYPAAQSPSEADDIPVELGKIKELSPMAIRGVPVPISGTVDVADTDGVTLTLVVPGVIDPGTDPIVAEVELLPDGSFVMPDIPSPGVYELIVEQPGSGTVTRTVVLQPGQGLDDIAITLRADDGLITGNVSGPAGPLGGATVTANDGSATIETVSLTEGDVGTFTLRNLAAPGQFTVTITKEGFSTEARTISLTTDVPEGEFNARLLPALGSISGSTVVEGSPGRGLEVALSGGAVNRMTSVISQGAGATTYSFAELPAPGTYTLTFTGPDLISQVQVVDLDPFSGITDVTGVDVNLSPSRTSVVGTVLTVDGSPAIHATVTLTDGTDSFKLLTADDPAGGFQFSNIAPGAYTVTASLTGTEPVVELVSVSATAPPPPLTLQLREQASLSGKVGGYDPAVTTPELRLFEPSQFPAGIPLATATPDPVTGEYTFTALDAPSTYIVAVYVSATDADPFDSRTVRTEPSQATQVTPDFNLTP
jgi:hypothetical protein